jgi:hypothetical protein
MSFIAAAVGGAATLAGSAISAGAAGKAADQQAAAAHEANLLQKEMYDQTRADNQPWRQAGEAALGGLSSSDFSRDFTQADFQQDPGYAFRMQEGQKALERSAAARGGLQSGGTMKALAQYGQNFASNEYNNAYNRFNADRDRRFGRLSSIAGVGQTANASNSAAGQNYANNVGSNTMGAANAAGAAGIASANAWGNTLSGLGKMGMEAASMNSAGDWMNRSSSSINSNKIAGNTYKGPGLMGGNYGIY